MHSTLQYGSIAALVFFANVGGQFAYFGFVTGNSVAWLISLFCILAAFLTGVARHKFLP